MRIPLHLFDEHSAPVWHAVQDWPPIPQADVLDPLLSH
jgi:hypothetical protein